MTEQPAPSDLAAWVLEHGVGLIPARQKQLAKGYRRLEAQADIRGRAVVIYQQRARAAEARIEAVRDVLDRSRDDITMHTYPEQLNADIRRALNGGQ